MSPFRLTAVAVGVGGLSVGMGAVGRPDCPPGVEVNGVTVAGATAVGAEGTSVGWLAHAARPISIANIGVRKTCTIPPDDLKTFRALISILAQSPKRTMRFLKNPCKSSG